MSTQTITAKDSSKLTKKKELVIVSPNTHWDREWRYPIWRTRLMLVDFMDHLLTEMDRNPEYRYYFLDGQSVPVKDYLEVKPHMEEKVRSYIAQGKIAVGPWYTAPDLYPVDGECLIRNLLKGTRLAKSYGKCLDVAYTSFGWGQTAQFPQIYKGFGIKYVMASKKVSTERAPQSEFLWESPDGTQVLTTRLGGMYRSNYFFSAYIPIRLGKDYCNKSDEFFFDNFKERLVHYRNANAENFYDDGFVVGDEGQLDPQWVRKGIETAIKNADMTMVSDVRLMVSGTDYSGAQVLTTEIINQANRLFEDKEFKHGSLDEYFEMLEQHIKREELQVVKGELRDGRGMENSGNALATRINLKVLNKKAQNALIREAEPLSCAAVLAGSEYPKGFLDVGWQHLLESHPHDSINGVTQDKTADDVEHRLKQACEIGAVVKEQALSELVKKIDMSSFKADDALIVIANPRAKPGREIIKLVVDFPQNQQVWDFDLVDVQGEKHAMQHVSRQEFIATYHDEDARPMPYHVDRHIVFVDTGEIPGLGYTTLKAVPTESFARVGEWWPTLNSTSFNRISHDVNTLENEYLKVTVNGNGTFDLCNKEDGCEYTQLHFFEDSGDVGDYWVRYEPYKNKTFTRIGAQADIWVEENGDLSATIGIGIDMKLPKRANRAERRIRGEDCRSENTGLVRIVTRVTLRKHSRKLNMHTVVDNQVEDHRLRVAFPTGIIADKADAAGHFCVDSRPVVPAENGQGTYAQEMQTLPQQTFVDISDGTKGFALVNNCLTEYEATPDSKRCVYLTLIRGVRNRICTEWRTPNEYPEQKGGQVLGKHEFEYALYPHSGNWETGDVYSQAETLNAPFSAVQTGRHRQGVLPLKHGFLDVQPVQLVVSAFKRAEDCESLVLRLYNPTSKTVQGAVVLGTAIQKAYVTNLDEVREEELFVKDGKEIAVSVASNKIMTIELEM